MKLGLTWVVPETLNHVNANYCIHYWALPQVRFQKSVTHLENEVWVCTPTRQSLFHTLCQIYKDVLLWKLFCNYLKMLYCCIFIWRLFQTNWNFAYLRLFNWRMLKEPLLILAVLPLLVLNKCNKNWSRYWTLNIDNFFDTRLRPKTSGSWGAIQIPDQTIIQISTYFLNFQTFQTFQYFFVNVALSEIFR